LLLAAGWAPAQEAQDAPQDATAPDAVSMDSRDRIFYPGDTERWKPLAGKLLGNTLLDQKEIWTSPFHMRRQDVKWWVGIAGVTALIPVVAGFYGYGVLKDDPKPREIVVTGFGDRA
jgi:hypothetical protein